MIEWSLFSSHLPSPFPHARAGGSEGPSLCGRPFPAGCWPSKAGFPSCASLRRRKRPHAHPVPGGVAVVFLAVPERRAMPRILMAGAFHGDVRMLPRPSSRPHVSATDLCRRPFLGPLIYYLYALNFKGEIEGKWFCFVHRISSQHTVFVSFYKNWPFVYKNNVLKILFCS